MTIFQLNVLKEPEISPQYMRPRLAKAPVELEVGQHYRSKRTGRRLTIEALEGDRVYYMVEDFQTITPLFQMKDRFLHIIGVDEATR